MASPLSRRIEPQSVEVLRSIGGSGAVAGEPLTEPRIISPRLRSHGVLVLQRLMTPAAAASLGAELADRRMRNDLGADDGVPGAWSSYAEPLFQVLLLRAKPIAEAITGAPLDPTYSYARVYTRGSELPPHVDREACEVSISIALGAEPRMVWPFWAEFEGRRYEISLNPGDGVLYLGHECRHWREPLGAEWSAHVFLHYVFADGEFAGYRFDQRP